MSLVGRVGRNRFRARLALLVIYGLLILGAAATLYPFLLMVSTGFKGPTDQNDNRLVPEYWSNLDGVDETKKLAEGSLLHKYLMDKYGGDLAHIASTRTGATAPDEELRLYEEFLMGLPVEHYAAGFRTAAPQVTSRLTRRYQAWLKQRFANVDQVNRAYVEENVAFQTVQPANESLERRAWAPIGGRKYDEWLSFKAALPAEFRIPVRETRMFQQFLAAKYQNQFAAVPTAVVREAKRFEEVRLPESGPLLQEFERSWLPQRYARGAAEASWTQWRQSRGLPPAPMPIEAHERRHLARHADKVRAEFSQRNFVYVLDYILLNGRALLNTAIFCLLAVLTQLIVNPLAAYALSRYPIRASGKILLFLLATMAFPAEVAMIPSFLLLKDLGLLNTFAALVLPTAASGYMIFLLKGFFDSLPQELFEAGQIDGAKETTMMMRIALPLSKPVLGYLALLAFMAAYSAFIYAFLVAQDQRMWTLMVWLYQLQTTAPKSVVMAGLTLAAIPTLLVFLLAQRVIMRGIVLPGER